MICNTMNIKFLCFILFLPTTLICQFQVDANIDLDLTYAESNSHYYYNEIHKERVGWSAGFSEARNYLGYTSNRFTFHFQQSLSRQQGKTNLKYQIEQLSAEYNFGSRNSSVEIGRVINPFGSFYNRQFSHHRNFLSAPLNYSYYHNISAFIGYQSSLGENATKFNDQVQWGSTTNYRYGYLNGVKLTFGLNDNIDFTTAFGNRKPLFETFDDPDNWEFIGNISMDVSWNFENALSFRINSFRQSTAPQFGLQDDQISSFTQWQLAYDFVYGVSYFELTGEAIFSKYNVPQFAVNQGFTLDQNEVFNENISSFSSYFDFKVEPPSLSGISFAYRLENILFGDINGTSWDNDVWRHSLIASYKLNLNLLARIQYSFQNVANKTWQQDFLRVAVTFHL